MRKQSVSPLGKPDRHILIFTIIMTIVGAIMIFDASVYIANTTQNNQYYFLIQQILWIVVGTGAAIVTYLIGYKNIIKLLPILLPVGIIALVAILIFGNEINGAKRWFNVAGIAIQPAEFIKPIIILYLASILAKDEDLPRKDSPWQQFLRKLLKFGPPVGLIFVLIALEPDFGTALVIMSTSLVLFFVSLKTFDDIKFFLGGFSLLAVLGGGVLVLEPYRIERIKTFFSLLLTGEVNDPRGTGYQMQQILIGIGSGGFLGKGFGQSRQRFGYLVENTAFTDSIFAVVLEEFGVLSGLILIGSWIFFLLRGFKIADAVEDKTGKYLAIGISTWLTLQALLNMAANVGIIPLTGIPLPFFTYGGSHTLMTFIGIALLLSVSREVGVNNIKEKPRYAKRTR